MERRLGVGLGFVTSLVVGAAAPTFSAQEAAAPLLIRGARVVDGTGAPARVGAAVLVDGGRIAAVGDPAGMSLPPGAREIDAAGRTLLPGLIDTHVHFRDYVAELLLAHGVTAVRDAGNPPGWIFTLRDLQAAGAMRGPRLFAVGNILDAPPPHRGHHLGVATPETAGAATRRLLAMGADGIKVYEKMTPELLRAVADEVHAAGRRVIGHVTMSARDAALAGIDALEHASGIALAIAADPALVEAIPDRRGVFGWRYMDAERAESLARLLVQEGVAVVPAMASWARGAPQRAAFRAEAAHVVADPGLTYLPEAMRERLASGESRSASEQLAYEEDYRALCEFLRRFRKAGGRVVVGTDGGGLLGLSVHHEMELLVDAGLTPLEAIHAATGAAAELLQTDALGVIAPGRAADLVLVDGRPDETIRDSRRIDLVIQGGRVIDTRFHADYRIPIPRPPVAGSRP